MKRGIQVVAGLAVLALAVAGYYVFGGEGVLPPITVGLLHSQTGPLAAREKPLIDAEVLALEEINASGGLRGRKLKWVIADGRSSAQAFAQQAERLITVEKVCVLFGGYAGIAARASSRSSRRTGRCLSTLRRMRASRIQATSSTPGGRPIRRSSRPSPGAWIPSRRGGSTTSVPIPSGAGRRQPWPPTRSRRAGQLAGEDYPAPDSKEVSGVVEKIKKAAPDVVLSGLEGATNAPFYEALARAGLRPDKTPVVSFTIDEVALRTLPLNDVAGHYAAELLPVRRPPRKRGVRGQVQGALRRRERDRRLGRGRVQRRQVLGRGGD